MTTLFHPDTRRIFDGLATITAGELVVHATIAARELLIANVSIAADTIAGALDRGWREAEAMQEAIAARYDHYRGQDEHAAAAPTAPVSTRRRERPTREATPGTPGRGVGSVADGTAIPATLRPREIIVLSAASWARSAVANGHYLVSDGNKRSAERLTAAVGEDGGRDG